MPVSAMFTILLLSLAAVLLLVFRSQLLRAIAAQQRHDGGRYPYRTRIELSPLASRYQAKLLEQQLGRMDDTAAAVDYEHHQAVVLTGQAPDLGALACTLEQAGCRAVSFSVDRNAR